MSVSTWESDVTCTECIVCNRNNGITLLLILIIALLKIMHHNNTTVTISPYIHCAHLSISKMLTHPFSTDENGK